MYMPVGSQCKKNQLIWINGLRDMASGRLNSNLTTFKFKQCKSLKFWFYWMLLVNVSS